MPRRSERLLPSSGVDFTVDHGSFFVILGPSGCGKTTTLAHDGWARTADLRPHPARRRRRHRAARVGTGHRLCVPAVCALPAHERAPEHRLSAASARIIRAPRSGAASRRRRRLLRIDHLLDRRVGGLSGGDRQRVALGRAIVRRPKAFLMDEPLGALDSEFRRLMCGELRELHDRIDATTVYITHDQLEAMAMADRIAIMNQGRVEQIGTPQEIYDRPAFDVRGRFHRRPANELSDRPGIAAAAAIAAIKVDGVPVEMPRAVRRSCRGLVRARRAARERVVRRCARACEAGDWRRISRHDANRHGDDCQRPDQGPAAVRQHGPGRRNRGASRCGRTSYPCSTPSVARRCPRRFMREIAMAEVALLDVSKSFGAVEAVRWPFALRSRTVNLSCCLARPVPERRRRLRLIAGLERPDRGDVVIQGRVVNEGNPGRTRRCVRLSAIFALSASDGL